jgi:hypothetical protein
MTTAVQPPTAQLVDEAIKKFDEENAVVEDALKKLFTQYPANTNLSHVLLKVVALNRLYSTQIFAVVDVAQHIHRNGTEIDSSLAIGSPEVVDKIAKVTISKSGKERNNFSFATKYCSWHNPESYPIFDTQVDRYLWSLQKQAHFAEFFIKNEFWDYSEFRKVMIAFRTVYGLESFTFKDIDKFLWLYGGKSSPVNALQVEAGSEP